MVGFLPIVLLFAYCKFACILLQETGFLPVIQTDIESSSSSPNPIKWPWGKYIQALPTKRRAAWSAENVSLLRTFPSSPLPSSPIFEAPTMCQELWYPLGTKKKAQEMWLSSHEDENLERMSGAKLAENKITNVGGGGKVQGVIGGWDSVRKGFLEAVTVELKD